MAQWERGFLGGCSICSGSSGRAGVAVCSSWGKKVGEEGLGDRLPSPSFLRLRIRPVGRLIRDAESVSFLEKWTFGERKRKLSGSKNNLEIVKRSKARVKLV